MKNKNTILINGDICVMMLYNKNKEIITTTTFNVWHLNKVKDYRWRKKVDKRTGTIYVISHTQEKGQKRTTKSLHSLILKTKKGMVTDHIDRNGLNNVDSNLRMCTINQNLYNQIIRKDNTSGYKGVTFVKRIKKWKAQIRHNNKRQYLGLFNSAKQAAICYNKKAIELHGEFACVNKNI
jgi:hypothetical protein